MTERQIENRAKKIKELEAEIKRLEEQMDALKSELKSEMEANQTEEIATKNFIIRWKIIVSNRLDTTALKTTMPNIYKEFLRESTSKRFTIA